MATFETWSDRTLFVKLEMAEKEHAAVRVLKKDSAGLGKRILRNRLWSLRKRIRAMAFALAQRYPKH